MESSATTANLALDTKQSEMAVRDLDILVWWLPHVAHPSLIHSLRSNGSVCLAMGGWSSFGLPLLVVVLVILRGYRDSRVTSLELESLVFQGNDLVLAVLEHTVIDYD